MYFCRMAPLALKTFHQPEPNLLLIMAGALIGQKLVKGRQEQEEGMDILPPRATCLHVLKCLLSSHQLPKFILRK